MLLPSIFVPEAVAPNHEHRPRNEGKPPPIPDHELLRRIGSGSYGDVWLARTVKEPPVTRWRIINQLNRRRRQEERHIDPGGDDSPGPAEDVVDPASLSVDTVWDAEWERSLLAAASERVKLQVAPEQFQIFDLYCIENWPVKKVAQTLGISTTQVYLAKHRIGRLMKKQVELLQRGESFRA